VKFRAAAFESRKMKLDRARRKHMKQNPFDEKNYDEQE
jgi:hypothetical protein